MVRGTSPEALPDVELFDLVTMNSGDGRVDERWDGDDARWADHHDAPSRVRLLLNEVTWLLSGR